MLIVPEMRVEEAEDDDATAGEALLGTFQKPEMFLFHQSIVGEIQHIWIIDLNF